MCRSGQPALPQAASARAARSASEATRTCPLHWRCVSTEPSHPVLSVCQGPRSATAVLCGSRTAQLGSSHSQHCGLDQGAVHWPLTRFESRATARVLTSLIKRASDLQGIGLDMLTETARLAQPTHVIQLQTPNLHRNLPPEGSWLPAYDSRTPANPAFLCSLPAIGISSESTAVRRCHTSATTPHARSAPCLVPAPLMTPHACR